MNKILRDNAVTTLIPSGDVVSDKVCLLSQNITDIVDDCTQIVVDMAAVSEIDSSGIGVLVSTQNRLLKVGGSLKVVNVADDIFTMFKIMRLDKHLIIEAVSSSGS